MSKESQRGFRSLQCIRGFLRRIAPRKLGVALIIIIQPGIIYAAYHPVEVIFLFDTSGLAPGDVTKARHLMRDLLENLPNGIHTQGFSFGSGFKPLNHFGPENLDEIVAGSNKTLRPSSLRLALNRAKSLLCQSSFRWNMTSKVVLILGSSSGMELSQSPNICRVTIYAISTGQENDPALGALTRRTGGDYYYLRMADGYAISASIKRKILNPTISKVQKQGQEEDNSSDEWARSRMVAGYAIALLLIVGLAMRIYSR